MRDRAEAAGCDRVMRPAHTLKEDWPGTIAHYGRGQRALRPGEEARAGGWAAEAETPRRVHGV